jgi:hypothetical protein
MSQGSSTVDTEYLFTTLTGPSGTDAAEVPLTSAPFEDGAVWEKASACLASSTTMGRASSTPMAYDPTPTPTSTITATLLFGSGYAGQAFIVPYTSSCIFNYSLTCTDDAICGAVPTVSMHHITDASPSDTRLYD